MNELTHVVMFGWIPAVLIMFLVLPPRRAVIAALVFGWLFLPNAQYPIPGFPDYTKITATAVAVLLGTLLTDSNRLLRFRPSPLDVPMMLFCVSPFVSSITNDLGAYDGASQVLQSVVRWGLPYLIGRLYFTDMAAMRELATGVVIGGMLYVPLCLWEVRMSPTLHIQLYGFRTRPFALGARYGGYRPMVFLFSYLPVVLWLSLSTIVAVRMWLHGGVRRLFGFPMGLGIGLLGITLVLCKSFIAAILVPIGLIVPALVARCRSALPFALCVLAIPSYLTVRATGLWTPNEVVDVIDTFAPERAHSLAFRLKHEDLLAARASERPVFGWGGFGRWRIRDDETGQDTSTSDALWIITYGSEGILGLGSLFALFVLPLLRFARKAPPRFWNRRTLAPAVAMAMVVLLTFVYDAANSSSNPVTVAAIGGLAAFTLESRESTSRRRGHRSRPVGVTALTVPRHRTPDFSGRQR